MKQLLSYIPVDIAHDIPTDVARKNNKALQEDGFVSPFCVRVFCTEETVPQQGWRLLVHLVRTAQEVVVQPSQNAMESYTVFSLVDEDHFVRPQTVRNMMDDIEDDNVPALQESVCNDNECMMDLDAWWQSDATSSQEQRARAVVQKILSTDMQNKKHVHINAQTVPWWITAHAIAAAALVSRITINNQLITE